VILEILVTNLNIRNIAFFGKVNRAEWEGQVKILKNALLIIK
jgi:hypothetical protein